MPMIARFSRNFVELTLEKVATTKNSVWQTTKTYGAATTISGALLKRSENDGGYNARRSVAGDNSWLASTGLEMVLYVETSVTIDRGDRVATEAETYIVQEVLVVFWFRWKPDHKKVYLERTN